jgi:hypothetical protein
MKVLVGRGPDDLFYWNLKMAFEACFPGSITRLDILSIGAVMNERIGRCNALHSFQSNIDRLIVHKIQDVWKKIIYSTPAEKSFRFIYLATLTLALDARHRQPNHRPFNLSWKAHWPADHTRTSRPVARLHRLDVSSVFNPRRSFVHPLSHSRT